MLISYTERATNYNCGHLSPPPPPQITGLKDTLIDYFVTATDTKGNVKKTDIYHVYIGAGNAACKG